MSKKNRSNFLPSAPLVPTLCGLIMGLLLAAPATNAQTGGEIDPTSYSFDHTTHGPATFPTIRYFDTGAGELTDGIKGGTPPAITDYSPWVGWLNDGWTSTPGPREDWAVNIDFVFSGGDEIDRIEVNTIQDRLGNIVIPDVAISSSPTGNPGSWTLLDEELTAESATNNNSRKVVAFSGLGITANHVRVTLRHPFRANTDYGPWIFCDEIDFSGPSSQANSISISFAGDNTGGVANQIAAGQTAGVVPDSAWNAATGVSGAGLALSNAGGSTGASVTWSSANTWGGTGATTDEEAMVNGWVDDGGAGATISISGIPYANYDVYAYGSSDVGNGGRGLTTNVNGTDYFSGNAFATLSGNGSFFDGTNYIDASTGAADPTYFRIPGLSGPDLTVIGARNSAGPQLPGGGRDYRGAISGIQIVEIPDSDATALRVDLNGGGSTATQAGWHSLRESDNDLGDSWSRSLPGGITVNVDMSPNSFHANRGAENGGGSEAAMWADFVAAQELQIRVTGLQPRTTYPITVWAFDAQTPAARPARWSWVDLAFGDGPAPASLDDYAANFCARTDHAGTLIMSGRLLPPQEPFVDPPDVFANGFVIGDPSGVADTDGDGLCDAEEGFLGTSRRTPDTDDDGASDRLEFEWGSDPHDAFSIPVISNEETISGGTYIGVGYSLDTFVANTAFITIEFDGYSEPFWRICGVYDDFGEVIVPPSEYFPANQVVTVPAGESEFGNSSICIQTIWDEFSFKSLALNQGESRIYRYDPGACFDDWAIVNGVSNSQAADDDGDGINHSLERAFNLDPTAVESTALDTSSTPSGLPELRYEGGEFELRYLQFQRLDSNDEAFVSYQPLYSTDLLTWQPLPGPDITFTLLNVDWDLATVRIPIDLAVDGQLFMKVEVTVR